MSEFDQADRAVTRAAVVIERAITNMLATTQPLESVAFAYVIEKLISELMERNPKALDNLNLINFGGSREAAMRLTNAIMDWRDMWEDR
jgi:hypothetical protein